MGDEHPLTITLVEENPAPKSEIMDHFLKLVWLIASHLAVWIMRWCGKRFQASRQFQSTMLLANGIPLLVWLIGGLDGFFTFGVVALPWAVLIAADLISTADNNIRLREKGAEPTASSQLYPLVEALLRQTACLAAWAIDVACSIIEGIMSAYLGLVFKYLNFPADLFALVFLPIFTGASLWKWGMVGGWMAFAIILIYPVLIATYLVLFTLLCHLDPQATFQDQIIGENFVEKVASYLCSLDGHFPNPYCSIITFLAPSALALAGWWIGIISGLLAIVLAIGSLVLFYLVIIVIGCASSISD